MTFRNNRPALEVDNLQRDLLCQLLTSLWIVPGPPGRISVTEDALVNRHSSGLGLQ